MRIGRIEATMASRTLKSRLVDWLPTSEAVLNDVKGVETFLMQSAL
jgi:hypothetical protein